MAFDGMVYTLSPIWKCTENGYPPISSRRRRMKLKQKLDFMDVDHGPYLLCKFEPSGMLIAVAMAIFGFECLGIVICLVPRLYRRPMSLETKTIFYGCTSWSALSVKF